VESAHGDPVSGIVLDNDAAVGSADLLKPLIALAFPGVCCSFQAEANQVNTRDWPDALEGFDHW
jgi:hypothetical protein